MIRKIAYLFGAGATHAELLALDPDLQPNEGLLISDVSTRVMLKASLDQDYLRDIDMVSGRAGSLNIELLISLIENSRVSEWSRKTDLLKKLIREDIAAALSPERTRRFFLHKALLEFLQSTYEAAAIAAKWERDALECTPGQPGMVRQI